MTDHRRALIEAFEAKGWTVDKLREESGLGCSRASLHRKLYGYRKVTGTGKRRRRSALIYQPLDNAEIAALATALDLRVDVTETVVTLGARAA